MSDRSVFVVADSRGRFFLRELHLAFTDIKVDLYWKKGLKLSETFVNTAPIVLNTRPKIIYIMNGICDLTYIKHREPWTAALLTRNSDLLVAEYMYAIDQVHSQFFGLDTQLGYKPMILFPTQTGINFDKYNNYPENLHSPEQPILDEAITIINRNLIGMHRATSVLPPILASAVHMRCRGKYRMAWNKLYDGCHPTTDLLQTWAQRLHYNAQLNLDQFDKYTLINEMYGQ